jgi:hypothetical protein
VLDPASPSVATPSSDRLWYPQTARRGRARVPIRA